jgi:uncharacterized protein (DUF1800 family)
MSLRAASAPIVAAALLAALPRVASAGMGFDDARHLLTRTGFAATPAQVQVFAKLDREAAVERILRETRNSALTPPPAWVSEPVSYRELRAASDEAKKELLRREIVKALELRAWWLQEMVDSPSPLTERMTLFWHNHFVSSQQKVKFSVLMYRQNALLRRYALGRFGDLLHAVSKDPAMIVYLDNASNRKAQPNENFAREVMELFTVGEGHYTEHDIKEAARAFTGWSIEPDTGEFKFRRFQHDYGAKTVLGRSGDFDGDGVLDVLLARPETAQFITAKLWRELISLEPDTIEVKRIAARFRESGYDIKVALRALLTSPAFYAPENRGCLIKSPVELAVGTLQLFEVRTGDLIPFALLTAGLGQNLFSPPNVRGWPGGEAWINSNTLLMRKQFLDRLFRAREMSGDPGAMRAAMRANGAPGVRNPEKLGEAMRERFIQALTDIHFDSERWLAQFPAGDAAGVQHAVLAFEPVNALEPGLQGMELVRALTQDPVYQLK